MIEQFGMAGLLASDAEIIDTANQSFAKQIHPYTVRQHAGGQGVLRAGHPLRELETAALFRWNLRRRAAEGGLQVAARHLVAQVAQIAPDMDRTVPQILML